MTASQASLFPSDGGVHSGAIFGGDQAEYRYDLWRRWDLMLPALGWIMLNPSTADASQDDPTIRRCIGFARDRGFGGVYIANLFAWRATDPKVMAKAADPVGPDNDRAILRVLECPLVVCAWGNGGALRGRAVDVLNQHRGRKFAVFKLTGSGHPEHPLYQPSARGFTMYEGEELREAIVRAAKPKTRRAP